MALAETANLIVKLSLGGNFASQIGKASRGLNKFDKDATRAYKAGAQIGTGIKAGIGIAAAGVGLLATQVGFGLDQLIQLESATAQTNAVVKSTKGVAGQTAASIRDLAEKYESLNATMDDKVIQSGANVLLTFTNIRKEAFEPTLLAALNLSQAMGQDLQSSIVQIGKALNDPIKGVGALRRVGVQLSAQQEEQITTLLKLTKDEQKHYLALRKTNKGAAETYKAGQINSRMFAAQKVILGELNTEFGDSFLAGGATTAGKVAKFGDAIEDLQKSLATALLPTVANVADSLSEFLKDPAVVRGAEDLGKQIGTLFSPANIKEGIGAIREGAGFLITIAGQVGTIVGTAVGLFRSLPPELQKLAIGAFAVNKLTGGLVTNLAGGLIGAVLSSFKGLMTVNAGVVNVNGAVTGAGAGATAGGAAGGKTSLVTRLFQTLGLITVAQIASEFADEFAGFGADLRKQIVGENFPTFSPTDLEWPFGPKNTPTILADILGGNGILGGRPRQKMPSILDRGADLGATTPDSFDRAVVPIVSAVDSLKGKMSDDLDSVEAALRRDIHRGNFVPTVKLDASQIKDMRTTLAGKSADDIAGVTPAIAGLKGKVADDLALVKTTIGDKVSSGAAAAVAAAGAGAARVAGAIASKDMSVDVMTNVTVNVTASNVSKEIIIQRRYGPGNGSRGSAINPGGFGPGGGGV